MAITVSFTEQKDSPKEFFDMDGITVVRRLKCAFADRISLTKELLGFAQGSIWNAPDLYAPVGGEQLFNVRCTKVTSEPIDTHNFAILTATYSTPTFDQETPEGAGGTLFVSESLEPSAELITIDETDLSWSDNTALKPFEAPSKLEQTIDWVYTIHNAITIPGDYFLIVGKINATAVTSRTLNITWPATTLMCSGTSARREWTSLGASRWAVTFSFTHKNNGTFASPKGWNYFARIDNVGGVGYNTLKFTGGSAFKVFTEYDFRSVII